MKVVAERLLIAVAALVMLGFGYINAGLNTYLPHVTSDLSVRPGQARNTTWFVLLAIWSVAMIVGTGLPRQGTSFWTAKGSPGPAIVQALSGLIAAVGVGLASALFNIGPPTSKKTPAGTPVAAGRTTRRCMHGRRRGWSARWPCL